MKATGRDGRPTYVKHTEEEMLNRNVEKLQIEPFRFC
jgi:hypothetical protein